MEVNIKERRTEKGWSQVELARKVGVSPLTIQMWERGVITPTDENYKKLMAALGVLSSKEG